MPYITTVQEFLEKNKDTKFILETSRGSKELNGQQLLNQANNIVIEDLNWFRGDGISNELKLCSKENLGTGHNLSYYSGWSVAILLNSDDCNLHFINGGNQILRSNIQINSSYGSGP